MFELLIDYTPVHIQPLVVTGPASMSPEGQGVNVKVADHDRNYSISDSKRESGSTSLSFVLYLMPNVEPKILKTSFSSIPVVSQKELSQEYRELGDALDEMAKLENGDEWRIDPPVLQVATRVATELKQNAFPAPQVFSHGPKSVVFNWSRGNDNLYLTMSADRVSALISTPQRITRRTEYTVDGLLGQSSAFLSLRSAYTDRPITLIANTTSDQSELISK